jgi:alkylated DNA repair dioxygenase AlkB
MSNLYEKLGFTRLDMEGACVLYCPTFFSDHETWYEMIDDSSIWQDFPVKVMGKIFNQPRKSFYMAEDGYTYNYSGFERKTEEFSVPVDEMRKEIQTFLPNAKKINAALGNKYIDGTNYIGKHSDSEKDLDPDSFIISVSLGAERDFIFSHKTTGEIVKIKLVSGSVLMMDIECQRNWYHTLPKRLKVKNITFRTIQKK